MGRINIEIPADIHKKAKVVAAVQEKTLIAFINEAIEEKLKREKAR